MKYHLNPKTGEPGLCGARKDNCPFGGEEDHNKTREEARSSYEVSRASFVFVPKIYPPILKFPEVWHVGTLDFTDRKAASYEGDGVSVSADSDAWRKIARLTGEEWRVSRKKGLSFAEWHGLIDEDRKELQAWGLAQGWVKKASVYQVTYWDDEWDSTMTLEFESLEEAMIEAETHEEEVKAVEAFRPTESFPQERVEGDPTEMLYVEYVRRHTSLDGVWWDDTDDVSRLSSPRGVIVRDLTVYEIERLK